MSAAWPVRIYSRPNCGDCILAKGVLDGLGIVYDDIDLDRVPTAQEEMLALNGGVLSVPTIVLGNGTVLVEPSATSLREAINQAGARGR